MAEGFQMMKRLFDAGAVHLAGNELAKQLFEEDHNPSYVAHEYLNRYWRPLFFADVARDFAGAKLEYVGAARAIDMFDKFFVTPTQAEIIGAVADPVVAETLRDYCRVRTFRADIHVKGLRRLSPREQEAGLASVPLALSGDTAEFPYRFGAPEGLVTLPEEIFKPIIEALAEQGPMTLGELLRQPGWPGQPPKSMAEAVGVLLATRRVAAAAPITDAAMVARCRRINSRAAQRIPELATRFGVPVAVPAVRNAGYMAPVDLIAVALLNNLPNLDDAGLVQALADLADPGELETAGGGQAAANPTERLAAMVADRRRIWRHLGLID
ncbi:hypothetical protein D3874_15950 [Oleomonas cavernae]|uniref:Methyltransferase regulatory domain-containing protein n=1 Tax=Oleomonas cavernae TaxID=2320859 RepID=A0A418WE80_9PROT|nr:methyltransferase regulatory domain-containing protein [Oleomonas cavernae]RJF88321.1 hypothetical protein D3874_15950 [Oleomonas cavernae]